ncbi:MAG TPA: hypothetical protein PKK00_04925 [Bacteroidales bacterium]|nr:hypothetical protein [Bacteroidales bacterium]HPS18497.1 hypothetical protein [Bacteroidales bacterium]
MTNIELDANNKSKALISAIIGKMSGINKSRQRFMITILMLYLGLRGRYNFQNMSRYGEYSEQTYRNQFDKPFDFMEFNSVLIKGNCSGHLLNAFDPSYIPKSGKETEHIGLLLIIGIVVSFFFCIFFFLLLKMQ